MDGNIGKRIRIIRNDHGLTQGQFANALRISTGHVSNLEKGRTAASDMLISVICMVWHINETWLRTGIGHMEDLDDKILKQLDQSEDNRLSGHHIHNVFRAKETESMQRVFAPAYPRYYDLAVLLTSDDAKDFRAILNAEIKAWEESDLRERLKLEIRLEDMFKERVLEMKQRSDSLPDEVEPVMSPAKPHRIKVPVVGRTAAGSPIEMIEFSDEEWEADDDDAVRAGDIIVEACGDSMIDAGIFDGDYCLIRPISPVFNGSIALVAVDGDSTIKRYYVEKDGFKLSPCNPAYEDMLYPIDANVKALGRFIKTVVK